MIQIDFNKDGVLITDADDAGPVFLDPNTENKFRDILTECGIGDLGYFDGCEIRHLDLTAEKLNILPLGSYQFDPRGEFCEHYESKGVNCSITGDIYAAATYISLFQKENLDESAFSVYSFSKDSDMTEKLFIIEF